MNLQYPKIQGKTEEEKISEIKNFLYELVDELQMGISDIERQISEIKKKQEDK